MLGMQPNGRIPSPRGGRGAGPPSAAIDGVVTDAVATERLVAGPAGIARAALLLRSGRLVGFGTETVYGLGADATDPDAVAAIYAAKRRPRHNPLIVHLPDAGAAFREVEAPPMARRLADAFWPGPLTLVLRRRRDGRVCDLAGAGLPTLAVRVPAGATALALLREAGRPIAAPSANPSGRVSPSTAAHVLAGLDGRIAAVLDCGACGVGLESTVLELTEEGVRLLRPGGVTREAIERVTGALLPAVPAGVRPTAPGQLASHYAPDLPLRLDAADCAPVEALLAFGPVRTASALVWNLSPDRDLDEAAARLFAGLRHLDAEGGRLGLRGIAAMPIPRHGLGLAIRDRLHRAAAPRPAPGMATRSTQDLAGARLAPPG